MNKKYQITYIGDMDIQYIQLTIVCPTESEATLRGCDFMDKAFGENAYSFVSITENSIHS